MIECLSDIGGVTFCKLALEASQLYSETKNYTKQVSMSTFILQLLYLGKYSKEEVSEIYRLMFDNGSISVR